MRRWLSAAALIAASCFLGLLAYDWVAVVALGYGHARMVPWRDFAHGAIEDVALTAVYTATVTPRVTSVISPYSKKTRRVCLVMLGLWLAWYEVMCAWMSRQFDQPPDLWASLVILFVVPMLIAPWYVRWIRTKMADG